MTFTYGFVRYSPQDAAGARLTQRGTDESPLGGLRLVSLKLPELGVLEKYVEGRGHGDHQARNTVEKASTQQVAAKEAGYLLRWQSHFSTAV